MKRKNKIALGIATVVGVFALGAVWLVNAAIGVVDDTVDTTVSTANAVAKIVKDEPVPAAKPGSLLNQSEEQNHTADVARQPGAAADEQVPIQLPVRSAKPVNAASASKSGDKASTSADPDDLTVIEHNFLPLFTDDADDAINVGALTKAFSDDSSDDDWLALVPGGKSPTLKRLMAGKYSGKEDQAVEDAIADPQAWRLFSFLGGML